MTALTRGAVRTSQPPGTARINPYWITRGLKFLSLGNGLFWTNTGGWSGSSLITGAPKRLGSVPGQITGYGSTSGGGTTDRMQGRTVTLSTAFRSLVAFVKANGTGGGAVGRVFQENGGSGGTAESLFCSATQQYTYQRSFNAGASFGQWNFGISGTVPTVDRCLGMTHDQTTFGNTPRAYNDGVGITAGVISASTSALVTGSYTLDLGNRSTDSARNWDGTIGLLAIFDHATIGLTDAEHLSLYRNRWQLFLDGSFVVSAFSTGIAFGAAGNSGDIAAASSYSGSASWSGTNRFLAIDVSMLGPGITVTAMTYGGAACTFIGSKSTVTSLGGVEQWRICSSDSGAPAAGSNTLSVTLSGSLEFSVEWASYTGVHQTSPTEGFNSAQATNAGSATDASVSITTVADNCRVHGAVVANSTSITANQTSRNNISGTIGSGANEDNNAPKTPAGAVTMSYRGMGTTTTWAIAGYAIRPVAASGLGGFFARWWYEMIGRGSNV